MRIGIRLAISGLVLASIIVSAIGVHVLWWRTAEANSHALADTINEQIVSAVEKELTTITTEARAAHTAIRTLFVQHVLETREADKREFVFLSQLQSQQNISWVAFGWPDGAFFAAHKLGDLGLEMMEIAPVDGVIKRRVDQYGVVVGDIEFEKRRFENTDYVVTDQEWYRSGMQADEPRWFNVTVHPVGSRPSIAYAGSLTPLAFPGWTLATVIREAEFLGPIEGTIRQLLIGLAILIVAAGIISAWLGRRVIATPLIMVVDELKHVARFDLEKVRRHASHLIEIENLSNAIADMAGGLAAFRKYIPSDLVKALVSEGIEPSLGRSIRNLTVMFADIAGFTRLSERLGDQIIPLLSSYLDTMSREVSRHGGTIDKFIGDAVMACWGAPAANADHAVYAY